VIPDGSVPESSVQVYGGLPPLAPSVTLYANPTWAFGRDAVVTARAGAPTLKVRLAEAVAPVESVTRTVSGKLPAVVGVPPSAPLVPVSEMPAGRLPAVIAHEYGAVPPVAAKVAVYANPTCPAGSEALVMARLEAIAMLKVAVPLPLPVSVSVTLKLYVPACVGGDGSGRGGQAEAGGQAARCNRPCVGW
jgi:hypothetical protein